MRTKWMRSSGAGCCTGNTTGSAGAASNGSAGCTSVRQIFLHPAEHGLVPQLAVQGAEHPMSLVGKHQHLAGHAVTPQRGKELQSLIDRNAIIELVGDDQRRRLYAFRESMRRPLRELLARLRARRR